MRLPGTENIRIKLLFVLLEAAAMLSLSCGSGGEREDPLAAEQFEPTYGGSLSSGFDGPNAEVNDQTKYDLCNMVFRPVYDVYYEALRVVRTAPDTGIVRLVGPVKGYALVEKNGTREWRSASGSWHSTPL